MKKSKWGRLGLGICLIGMLVIFQGTLDHDMACWFCMAEASISGYLEIHNNTPYNISVKIIGPNVAGPYKITANPPFLRKMLLVGNYRVGVSVCNPIDQKPVLYRVYNIEVLGDLTTVGLTVTTPIGYIPFAQ